MDKKDFIRKRYFLRRKKKYFEINKEFFNPLIKKVKKNFKKKIYISLYYPTSNELNVLKLIDLEFSQKLNFLLPVITKNNSMFFCTWKKNDVLYLNKFGIPEPKISKKITPNIILVPLLAFDKNKNRIGYGRGFYDKYLKKYAKTKNFFLTVGVAFSFQKYHKIPINNKDYKLDHIITEKGII